MSNVHSRVVLASRLFVPEVSAGAFRLKALVSGLRQHEADVQVLTTTAPHTAPEEAVDLAGVRISRAPVLRDRGGNVRGYVQYLSFDVPLVFRLLFTRYDVAVAEAPPTTGMVVAMVSALKRRPYAYYAADIWTDGTAAIGAPSFVVRIIRALEGHVMRRASCVLSISDEVTDRITEFGVSRERIATVGNGVDTSIFNPSGRAQHDAGRYFVYTGTMSEWQGPDVFIRALAKVREQHPDVMLRFFGQGAVEDELKRVAEQEVPGGVEFGGVIPPATTAEWIRGAVGAMVSIVPGLGYDFARPTKTYAAAACGTPVVFAGSPESSGGLLVSSNGLGLHVGFDAELIAGAMLELLDEHDSAAAADTRTARAQWVEEHASLNAVGAQAAEAVLAGLRP